MTSRTILALMLLLLLLVGCSHHPTLVGKWSGTGPMTASGLGSDPATMTYEFGSDGVVTFSAKATNGKSSVLGNSFALLFTGDVAEIHAAGTYTVKDDVVTITLTQWTLLDAKGQPPSITPEIKKEPRLNRFKVSGDTLTLDALDGAPPLRLTRRKS